jgi:hypothetical protein
MSCFSFFFYKIREQEGRTGPAWGEVAPVGGRRWQGKGYEGQYDANTVYTFM